MSAGADERTAAPMSEERPARPMPGGRSSTPAPTSYVRRDDEGRSKEVEDVGRSLAQDQKRQAEGESRPGYGDKGDRS